MKTQPDKRKKKQTKSDQKAGRQETQKTESKNGSENGKKHRKGWIAEPIVLKNDWSKRGERKVERIDVSLDGRFVFGNGRGSMCRRAVDGQLQSLVE